CWVRASRHNPSVRKRRPVQGGHQPKILLQLIGRLSTFPRPPRSGKISSTVYSIRLQGKTLIGWVLALVVGLQFRAPIINAQVAPTRGATTAKAARQNGPLPLPPDLPIPHYNPGPPPFRNGETLVYAASWMGIPAAQATIIVARDRAQPSAWSGRLWINTSRAVDVLYRMRDYVDESFSRDSLRP